MSDSKIDAVIALWPTVADFAAAAGVSYGAAKQMRRRRSIALKYWAALLRDAAVRGLPLDEAKLVAAHSTECVERAP